MRRNPERRKAKMLAKWEMRLRSCDYQPHGTNVCGQIAVATIVRRPLLEVLERFGKDGRTTAKGLAAVLLQYGYAMRLTRQRKRPADDQLAIGSFRPDKCTKMTGGHWVVWREGEYFDATPRNIFQRDYYDEYWKPKTWHIIERTSDNGTAVPLT